MLISKKKDRKKEKNFLGLETHLEPPNDSKNHCLGSVMTSNDYRIVNSQSQRIVHSEVQ